MITNSVRLLTTRRRVAISVLAVTAATFGVWMLSGRLRSSAVVPVARGPVSATDVLATIPAPVGTTMTDKAIAKFEQRLRQNPKDDRSWSNLGDALMQHVRETADYNYYNLAQSAYEQALVSNPRSSDAMTGLAWVNGGRHAFELSIDWARRAIELDPKNNMAYGIIGDAQLELGEYDAAFASYQKMLDIRPDISSYSRGAWLLYVTGDTRKARWLMAKAILSGSIYAENTAWCRSRLALILISDGNLSAAEDVLKDAAAKSPGNYHVLATLGKVEAALRKYPEAIKYYRKALSITQEHTSLVALGDIYKEIGDEKNAKMLYESVEALHAKNNGNGSIHDHMQMAQYYADHDVNLIEALRLAEEHKLSKNVFDSDILAWCYYKNDDLPAARKAIARAMRQHTPDARILFHAGMIEAKAGNHVSAKKLLYDALTLNGTFSERDSRIASRTLRSEADNAHSEQLRIAAAQSANSTQGTH